MFISTQIKFMQMFEYEGLYNTKIFGQTFHVRRWKYLQQYASCSKSQGTLCTESVFTTESHVFQANISPLSFYENSISSCRVSQNPQHTISSVFRRLANSESIQKMLLQDQGKCLNLLISLGFVINKDKSSLESKQSITYLCAVFFFHKKKVVPPQDRLTKLLSLTKKY